MFKKMKKMLFNLEDISLNSDMKVVELQEAFVNTFATQIRIYKTLNTQRGSRLANDNTKLSELASNKDKFGDIFIKKDNTVGEIENQFANELGIGIQIMLTNGVEFAPNESIVSEVKNIECKPKKESEMALNISGRMKVKTLKKDFKDEFGLSIRVYEGKAFADDDATLASIRKGDSKGGEFSPKKNTKVGNLEDKIMGMFGIKTQISGSDDSYLCDNDLTLKAALEEDEKKMARKEKKAARNTLNTDETVNDGSDDGKSCMDIINDAYELDGDVKLSKLQEAKQLASDSYDYTLLANAYFQIPNESKAKEFYLKAYELLTEDDDEGYSGELLDYLDTDFGSEEWAEEICDAIERNDMSFDEWDGVLADQGIMLEEAAEAMDINMSEIKKWENTGKVPKKAIDFIRAGEDDYADL